MCTVWYLTWDVLVAQVMEALHFEPEGLIE
jgi:hypothetical protein